MLPQVNWKDGDNDGQAGELVYLSQWLPGVFRARMEQLEDIHRWLGAYFQAVAIMLQMPGATEYRFLCEDPDEAGDYVWKADRPMLFSILAECLERLDCAQLMRQVPGGDDYRRRELPVELRLMLAQRDRNALFNLVTECLDRLMVIPYMDDTSRRRYEGEPRRETWSARLRRFFRRLARKSK